MPALKRYSKTLYQRINYLLYRPDSKVMVADGWKMQKVGAANDLTFFGYYDKSCWNAASTQIATHRLRGANCEICVASDKTPSELIVVATTTAWNWQQGAMLSWAPDDTLFFNDFADGRLIARKVSATGGLVRNYDLPVQSLSPDGTTFMSLNYNRLRRHRAEYGYSIDGSNSEFSFDDETDGIWSVDTVSGEINLVINFARLKKALPNDVAATLTAHKINHICWSPNSKKVLFMYRFFQGSKKSSRLYLANAEGDSLVLVADNELVSHYTWLDNARIVAWARNRNGRDGYSIYNIDEGSENPLSAGEFDHLGDGHPSIASSGELLAFDTYPLKDRCRRLYVFSEKSGAHAEVARLFATWKNEGPRRCDLHPRWAPDAHAVSVDSDFTGLRSHYVLRR